jgi:hypothetical protein
MAQPPILSLRLQVASQAKFIVNNLQHTDYQFTDNIDVDRGIYDCDCSGFAAFLLLRAAPGHYAMVPHKESGQPNPRAFEYYEFLDSLTSLSADGWRRIDFLRDARRGDVIAWRLPKIRKHRDTGHVCFVADTPTENGNRAFNVIVYDSANQPHFGDTRGKGEGRFANGVGSGVVKFRVDNTGRPAAFQLAPADQFVSLPIAIGRIESLPPATES